MKMIDEPVAPRGGAASRTGRRPPAASAPRSARRGSGCARRGRAPSGSRPAASRRPRGARRAGRAARRARCRPSAPSASCARRARSSRSEPSGRVPSTTFSSTVRLSASAKCWCTMPMPAASAACGEPGASGASAPSCAGHLDRPCVGHVVAEQDVHQRGLAGAVLAEQREDLAAPQVEIDRRRWRRARRSACRCRQAQDAAAGRPRTRDHDGILASIGRLRLGVVDLDAEHAVEDLLLLLLDQLHHVGRHQLLVHRRGSRRHAP